LIACSLFLTALVGLGCSSSDEHIVASVDGYEITYEELDRSYGNRSREFATDQEHYDAFRGFLDTLVVERMLIRAAYDHGMDQSEEINRLMIMNKNKFLVDALYKREVVDKVNVSEAEVRDYYDKLGTYIKAYHILVGDPDTAQSLVDRILAGENFEELAYRYSIAPNAKQSRGELGYFTWGEMVPEFQQAAFNMEVGEISPPVKTQFGYHVIRVTEKIPNESRGSYETEERTIRNKVTSQRARDLSQEYLESIRAQFPVTVDTVTLDYLIHKRKSLYPPSVLATLPDDDFDDEQLDRDERELIVATWNGGQMSLYDYLVQSRRDIHPSIRPPFDDYDSLGVMIFQLNLDNILAQEAIRVGIEQDPQFESKFLLFKEFNMADAYRSDSLPQSPEPTEDEVRARYDNNIEEYMDADKVRVFEILVSDEMTANKLAREIKTIEEFKEKAADLTERPSKRGTNGDLDYIEQSWFPDIFDVAWETPVGSLGGPVRTLGKYSIFWVADKIKGAPKDFLQVKAPIKNKMILAQRDSVFKEWVDNNWDAMSVAVFEDALWSAVENGGTLASAAEDGDTAQ
jgi:parvulin-like peptidyl-prolyl isomerase